MARPHSPKIRVLPEVSVILEKIKSSGTSEQRHSNCNAPILLIGTGVSNQGRSQISGRNYKTVKKWRFRYLGHQEKFDQILLQPDQSLKKKHTELLEGIYEML